MLVSVAFLTLLERKILGYSQARKGPNKVTAAGVLQPFGDAVKLLFKEFPVPEKANLLFFWATPGTALLLVLLAWATLPMGGPIFDFSLICLLLVLGLGLYPLFLSAWSSNRAYATIGALRGVAQTISYEVRLAVVFLGFFAVVGRLALTSLRRLRRAGTLLALAPAAVIWLISGLAETNRTPFDFAEGERELVSGFNIEYGSGGFVMIFLAEYAAILLMSLLTALFLTLMGLGPRGVVGLALVVCYF